jgi:hypothetical protein
VTLPIAIEDRLRLGHLPSSHREAPVSGVTAEAYSAFGLGPGKTCQQLSRERTR